jgi:thymidylate synthase ThyX
MINVKVIADSVFGSNRVTTFELEYPRYVHSELMTHRVFSRNAASSRAIPIEKMIEQATDNTVMPMWTHNQPGMQGKPVTDIQTLHAANGVLQNLISDVVNAVRALDALGIHKQNANRYLEPFQHIKTVVTATEYENFFNLRYHEDAQPEIRALAVEMYAAYHKSVPRELEEYEWHLPYVEAPVTYSESQGDSSDAITLEEAQKISASCCAQVSYRRNDTSLEKAETIFERLVGGDPLHASPFEHACRPLLVGEDCSNFKGFRQLRQDIEEK